MRQALTLAALLLCLHLSASARAQPINAETLRTAPFDPGWSGTIDTSLSLSRGNVDLVNLGGSANVEYQTLYAPRDEDTAAARPAFLRHRGLVRASATFARQPEAKIVHQGFGHARATSMWHRRVGTDVFGQLQYNEFQHLRLRTLLGFGARFVLLHEQQVQIWGSTTYMFEHERVTVAEGSPDAPRTTAHRWSNSLTARFALMDDQLLIKNTLFYQPRFDAFSDFRLLEELELASKVNDMFSLGVSLQVLHDHRPPTDVERTDLRLTTKFKITL